MRQALRHAILAAGMMLLAVSPSKADLLINEVFTNPPGADTTQEFFELKSTTGVESMAGLHLLIVEGEDANAGIVDQAFDLGTFSTGTNGLFYWRADVAVGSFSPAPNPASTVNTADFSPDLENGTQTYILVRGFTGTAGTTDLDSDNNGTVDTSPPWSAVIDAIGVRDGTAADLVYASNLGFSDFPVAPTGFEAEVILRLSGSSEWVESDISGTNPGGPYSFDTAETFFIDGTTVPVAALDFDDVSPGSANPQIVPEPGAILFGTLVCGLVGTVVGTRRLLARATK